MIKDTRENCQKLAEHIIDSMQEKELRAWAKQELEHQFVEDFALFDANAKFYSDIFDG